MDVLSRKPRGSNNFLLQWLVLALAMLATGCLTAFSITQEHGRIEKQERERLATQAKVINANLVHQLGGIYQALDGIRNELQLLETNGGMEAINHRLTAMTDAVPGIRTTLVANKNGIISACNRKQIIGEDIHHRLYFQEPLHRPNRITLYVSPPFRTILGNFVINISLMVPGPAGEFAGVISAALDPEYFKTLLGSVLYAPDMWAALSHGDGKLFLLVPERKGVVDLNLARNNTPFTRHPESGNVATVLTGMTLATGEERMMAQHTVKPASLPMDKPLVVAVTRDISVLYADWRTDSLGKAGLFVVLLLTSALSLRLYQHRQRKFEAVAAGYEAEQRVYAERLKLATEAAGLGVWEYDLESGQLTWDNAMLAIYGKESADFFLNYDDWRNCVLPEDLEGVENLLREAINNGQPFNTSFHIRRPDGNVRIIHVMARVHVNESGRPVRMIGINEDITEQQQEAEELRNAKEAAVNADVAKSRFLSMVAHEFRTPLSLLTSSSDILERYGEKLSLEQHAEQKRHMRSAMTQLANLVDSVLNFCRQEADNMERTPVLAHAGTLCCTISRETKTALGAEHEFIVKITDCSATALLDEILFRRVLENLLGNAFRYTPAGGVISLTACQKGDRLLVEIADCGIGIPENERERIFDQFYRCGNVSSRRGLGLGLHIVREALLQMKGSITLSSRVGEGTTVRLEIPVVDESASQEQHACIQS